MERGQPCPPEHIGCREALAREAAALHSTSALQRTVNGINRGMISCRLPIFIGCVLAQFAFAIDDYKLGPDSQPRDGVPKGEVTKYKWESKVFPGTVRDYWVYVPAQYKSDKPACVMVFQDGAAYVS